MKTITKGLLFGVGFTVAWLAFAISGTVLRGFIQ